MAYNNVRECELAFSRNEVKEYLEGIGVYQEPPDRYSNTPPVDIFTRNNCINILYDKKKEQKIIDQYSDAIISLTKGDVKQIHIAMQYIMAQLQLESNNRASFNLNNKEFYEQIREVISSKENEIKSNHDKELSDMWDILELQDEYISSKTGYNIK